MQTPESRRKWLATVALVAATAALGWSTVASTPGSGADAIAAARPKPPKQLPDRQAAGAIETLTVNGTEVSFAGWALDLNDPASAEVRVSLNGELVDTVATTGVRRDVGVAYGSGAATGFEATISIPAEGTHSLCVFTAPDDDLVACTRVAAENRLGVLITPRNVMVKILKVLPNGYRVQTPCGNKATVAGGERIRTTQILIDPGHGGSEVASVGPNRLSEKNLNLSVAKRAAKALRERGYSVELTRTTDVRLPVAIRAGLANALEPDLFLSLHHNGGATRRSSVPGTQVYYQQTDPEARRASGILYEELFAAASAFPTQWVGNALDGVSTRLNAEGGDFYGIHRRTPDVTSVITEFLWLSNGPEAALLAGSEIRDAEAEALALGIDRWFRTKNKGSGYLPEFVDTFDSGGGGFDNCVDPQL